jgi:glycosyltransferase A (GT-A) superfamily protein (DUF2064 family)
MNKEIIIAYLNEHEVKCPYGTVSTCIKKNNTCALCSHMNRDVTILITKIRGARDTVDVGIALAPKSDAAPYEPYRVAGFRLFRQNGKLETERIESILHEAIYRGYESVVLISHNVPNLPLEYIEDALEEMRNGQSLVLGPSENGMFYLIGIEKNLYEQMVRNETLRMLSFYNHGLLESNLKILQKACNTCVILPKWYLLKSLEDVKRLHDHSKQGVGWNARWTRLIAQDIID